MFPYLADVTVNKNLFDFVYLVPEIEQRMLSLYVYTTISMVLCLYSTNSVTRFGKISPDF